MQKILVLNSKGGSGKTTIAINLASYYANKGEQVAIVDNDPQASASHWLKTRSSEKPSICLIEKASTHHVDKINGHINIRPFDKIIIDSPSAVHREQLQELVRQADAIIIPVLPSPIDIHAAARFIQDLLLFGKARYFGIPVSIVANRSRKHTLIYTALEKFLKQLNLPFITSLRDTQNYVHAAESGVGIFEMQSSKAHIDQNHWQPLLFWLNSQDFTSPANHQKYSPLK